MMSIRNGKSRERDNMTKAGERLLKSVREARAYARGEAAKRLVVHVPTETNKQTAKRVKLLFEKLLGAPVSMFPNHKEKLNVPDSHGVYVIYGLDQQVCHVGRSVRGNGGLCRRLKNHMHGQSSFTINFLQGNGSQLRCAYSYRYLIVEDERLRALLEAYATGHLCPAHLGLGAIAN